MRLRTVASFLAGTGLLTATTGCVHAPLEPPAEETITGMIFVSAPPASMAVNASATLSASLTYNGDLESTDSNAPIQWSVTCGSANACGSFTANNLIGAVTYAAPAAVPAGGTVTITASGSGQSVSVTVNITPPVPIQVSFYAPPPASLDAGATFRFSALIANDTSAKPQVTWSVTCGNSACGTLSPTTTGNENPTTYNAPAAIPPGGGVTVTMTSVADPTKTASATIAILEPPSATLANGTYVFQLSGSLGLAANFITGAFVASNGSITGGEQDTVNYNGPEPPNAVSATQTITGGSYGLTSDGNLQISIQAGVDQTETLEGSLAANGHGFVKGIAGAPMAGTLDLQSSTAAPSGGYALSLSGGDVYFDEAWIGGVVNVDGQGTISGAGSLLDVTDPGLWLGTTSLAPSTVSAPDGYGRVVMKLYPAGDTGAPSLYLAAYTIDGSQMRLIETLDNADSTNFEGVMSGVALGQGTNTGKFNTASVAGQSYVLAGQGFDETNLLDVAGVVTFAQNGSIAGQLNWNDQSGTAAQSPLAASGSWSVDPTGRVTVTNLTDESTFSYSLHLYLTGSGQGLLQSNDENDDFNGELFQQQSGAALSGAYGLSASEWVFNENIGGMQPQNVAGSLAVESAAGGSLSLSGYADAGVNLADFAVAGVITPDSAGVWTGTLAGFTPAAPAQSNAFSLYVVDNTQAVLMETDSSQLVLGRISTLP